MKNRDKEAIDYANSLERRLIEVTPWIPSTRVVPPCGLFIEASWSNGGGGWVRSDVYIDHIGEFDTMVDAYGNERPLPDFWRLQQDVPR